MLGKIPECPNFWFEFRIRTINEVFLAIYLRKHVQFGPKMVKNGKFLFVSASLGA